MHTYFRTIGFEKVFGFREREKIINHIIDRFEEKETLQYKDHIYMEISRGYGDNMGVTILGELDGYGFHPESFFPYVKGKERTECQEIIVEKNTSDHGLIGMIEKKEMEIAVIFSVSNPTACRKLFPLFPSGVLKCDVRLSALSVGGEILLPGPQEKTRVKIDDSFMGDNYPSKEMKEAFLTEMVISKRLETEDLMSIIETSFLPHGCKSDQYQIMGIIQNYEWVENTKTDCKVCQMEVVCNNLNMLVCINQKDLEGEPEVGRRFRGIIWLQGEVVLKKQVIK